VYFNGYKTNLHAAWDTSIPNGILGLSPTAKINITTDSQGWADTLAAEVNSGEYLGLVPRWLKHLSVADQDKEEKAATEWANESNREVCDYAMIEGGNVYNGTEIGGAYFDGAKPIVEVSIAKAGVRLAAWLNLIFEGKTGFEGRGRGSHW
jgi:sulfite reductase beta subunit-like hemoprotein